MGLTAPCLVGYIGAALFEMGAGMGAKNLEAISYSYTSRLAEGARFASVFGARKMLQALTNIGCVKTESEIQPTLD